MRFGRESIQGGSIEAVFLGDVFGSDSHGDETSHGVSGMAAILDDFPIDLRWEFVVEFVHGVGAHGFDAGADADGDGAGLDGVGDVGDGLEAGGALAVGGGEGGGVGDVGGEGGHAEGDGGGGGREDVADADVLDVGGRDEIRGGGRIGGILVVAGLRVFEEDAAEGGGEESGRRDFG
mmetsp:Transcript_15576/g.30480  ORF Transcript_15576/g.30480 Transcript_15576/m.30480 type:complete len:178 (-) Transcript_15576:157-690(-)